MMYIIDTFAWVEYFRGTPKGEILKKTFWEKNSRHITMECCIAELIGYCLRNSKDFRRVIEVVKTNSILLPVTQPLWIGAAKTRFHLRKRIPNFGLVDAILAAKQQELKCRIISGDPHFKTVKNVLYIGD
jgi:predicted nucleic acid-binding protein